MPVTYGIDATAKTIRTTCSRHSLSREVIEHFRCLKEDSACSGPPNVLLDVLAGDDFSATRVFRKMDEAEAWLASQTLADPQP